MPSYVINSAENTSTSLYGTLHNGLVRTAAGVFWQIDADTSDDIFIRSSSDGATWTTGHTKASGGLTVEQLRIIIDHDDYIHAFVVYDNAGTANIWHFTNRTGAWVATDITAGAWNAATKTARWAGLQINHFDNGGTASAITYVYDGTNDTIRAQSIDLETAPPTVSYDEDALAGGDSGDINLSPQFTGGPYNRTQLSVPSVQYTINGVPRFTNRTGVATYQTRDFVLTTSKSRPNFFFTDHYSTFTVGNFLAAHWYDGTNYKVEIFKWNDTTVTQLDTLGEINLATAGLAPSAQPTAGSLGSYRDSSGTPYVEELIYIVSVEHSTGQTLIHIAASAGGQVFGTETVASDNFGDGFDLIEPQLLVAHQQQNTWPNSQAVNEVVYVYHVDTGGASDTKKVGTLDVSLVAAVTLTATGAGTDGSVASDSAVVSSHSPKAYDIVGAGASGSAELIIGGGGSASYPYYKGAGTDAAGKYTVEPFEISYPTYAAVGSGDDPNESWDAEAQYARYEAIGTGIGVSGGSGDVYQTIYDKYTASGVGATGFIGTGAVEYPSYESTGNHFWGSGTAEYPSYAIVASTPGVGIGEGVATGSMSYRAYTIAATTLSNTLGIGTAAYRVYTATGVGLHDSVSTVIAAYEKYQALGWGVAGRVGTGTAEYPVYEVVATGIFDDIVGTGSATASYKRYMAWGEGQSDFLEEFTGRLVTADGEAITANGEFIVLHEPRPAEFEVVFSAMNLQKKAVTEYQNFDFNSIDRNKDGIYAANSDGIYILGDSLDDDGDAIVANVEKVGIDYDSPNRKRATDAYLHIQSGGTYTFSSIANLGRSDQVIEDTDTYLHTRKIDLAKGLIGRNLGWALRTSGVYFELEEIELIVDMGTRRIRRYV